MKLQKAKEILSDAIKGQWPTPNTDLNDAIKLGIEALTLVDQLRFDGSPYYPTELPGETPEED